MNLKQVLGPNYDRVVAMFDTHDRTDILEFTLAIMSGYFDEQRETYETDLRAEIHEDMKHYVQNMHNRIKDLEEMYQRKRNTSLHRKWVSAYEDEDEIDEELERERYWGMVEDEEAV